jgi:hypothetical protein
MLSSRKGTLSEAVFQSLGHAHFFRIIEYIIPQNADFFKIIVNNNAGGWGNYLVIKDRETEFLK